MEQLQTAVPARRQHSSAAAAFNGVRTRNDLAQCAFLLWLPLTGKHPLCQFVWTVKMVN